MYVYDLREFIISLCPREMWAQSWVSGLKAASCVSRIRKRQVLEGVAGNRTKEERKYPKLASETTALRKASVVILDLSGVWTSLYISEMGTDIKSWGIQQEMWWQNWETPEFGTQWLILWLQARSNISNLKVDGTIAHASIVCSIVLDLQKTIVMV